MIIRDFWWVWSNFDGYRDDCMTIILSLSSFWQGNFNIMSINTWISNTWSCYPSISGCSSWLWTTRHRNRSRVFYCVAWVINNTLQRICFPDCCLINFLSYRINYCVLKSCLALQSTSRIRLSSKATCWIDGRHSISRLVTYRIRPP